VSAFQHGWTSFRHRLESVPGDVFFCDGAQPRRPSRHSPGVARGCAHRVPAIRFPGGWRKALKDQCRGRLRGTVVFSERGEDTLNFTSSDDPTRSQSGRCPPGQICFPKIVLVLVLALVIAMAMRRSALVGRGSCRALALTSTWKMRLGRHRALPRSTRTSFGANRTGRAQAQASGWRFRFMAGSTRGKSVAARPRRFHRVCDRWRNRPGHRPAGSASRVR
jgi:hypothetical protein